MADRPRILLVDDERGILELLRETLDLDGVDADVQIEADSRAAVTRLAMERYDLVVSDFRMPGLDGVDVLRASRSRNPDGRRVLFTGYNEVPTAAARMEEAKPDVVLHKPIGPAEFIRTVRSLLPAQR